VFGDHLQVDDLVTGTSAIAPWVTDNTMTPRYTPWFPAANYSNDFSGNVSNQLHHHFIHEMSHVLQSQNGNYNWLDGPYFAIRYASQYGNTYPYDNNDLGRPLSDFNFEQQADIIADYFTGNIIPQQYQNAAWQTIEGFDTQGDKYPDWEGTTDF